MFQENLKLFNEEIIRVKKNRNMQTKFILIGKFNKKHISNFKK